jgi:hypothetical protein
MVHRCFSGPPKTFSPPFYPLYKWIHGTFPAIEFAVAPSPSLPNSSDPGATLARACLNSSDLTTSERSGAASRTSVSPVYFPPSDLDRTARTAGYHFAHARLTPCVGVLGPTAHLGLPLKVFLGVGRCRRL